MTEQQIKEGNKQIELHNKFCFMKTPLPMYKEIVPIVVPFSYAVISACLLALPTLLSVGSACSGSLK